MTLLSATMEIKAVQKRYEYVLRVTCLSIGSSGKRSPLVSFHLTPQILSFYYPSSVIIAPINNDHILLGSFDVSQSRILHFGDLKFFVVLLAFFLTADSAHANNSSDHTSPGLDTYLVWFWTLGSGRDPTRT